MPCNSAVTVLVTERKLEPWAEGRVASPWGWCPTQTIWASSGEFIARTPRRTISEAVMRITIAAVLIAALPAPALAGTVTGKVMRLTTRTNDGLQIVTVRGPLSGRPACATYDYFMIKDEKSDTGKAQYAMLMAAFLSGRSVIIDGTGACTRWGDGEDIGAVTYQE